MKKVTFLCVLPVVAFLLSPGRAAVAQSCNLPLPCGNTVSSSSTAFSITNTGTGRAGAFQISNAANGNPALQGSTNSTSMNSVGVLGTISSTSSGNNSAAVRGINRGSGAIVIDGTDIIPIGVWGSQEGVGIGVKGDSRSGIGVQGVGPQMGVQGIGTGTGLSGQGTTGVVGDGSGRGTGVQGLSFRSLEAAAGTFVKGDPVRPQTLAAVEVRNTLRRGEAAWLQINNPSNPEAVLKLLLSSESGSNFLECHRPDFSRKCRINRNGSFVSGSDFAEALPAQGHTESYEPGDVLVLAADGSAVEKTSDAYSRRIVGVYSTRPAILGADKNGDTRVDPNDIPVAVMGIVPTKVTTENGSIRVGDLLVTASRPAHAMKAQGTAINGIEVYPSGTILGKALEPLQEGTGVIKVLVMLQ